MYKHFYLTANLTTMKKLLILLSLFFLTTYISAQVTTAALGGLVTDESGTPLIGAAVSVVHLPTQSTYGVITQTNGRYNIPNMTVGGPYTVTVDYIGYSSDPMAGVFLELGQKLNLNVSMTESGVVGEEVVITGSIDPILNGDRTGAETTIGSDLLNNLPPISRSADDYTRLNPMAAEGGSFAGRNDQFNNYSLDGSIFNNPFGLDAATPGGQTDAQPVSLDAIEQINVAIAPFDVTQSGFTGAAINAVTKSGTNELSGTVYGFFRNKDFIGSKVRG